MIYAPGKALASQLSQLFLPFPGGLCLPCLPPPMLASPLEFNSPDFEGPVRSFVWCRPGCTHLHTKAEFSSENWHVPVRPAGHPVWDRLLRSLRGDHVALWHVREEPSRAGQKWKLVYSNFSP